MLAIFMVWRMWVWQAPLQLIPWPGFTRYTVKQRPAEFVPTALLYERSWECHQAKVWEEPAAAPPVGYREPECRPEALELKP